MVVVPMGLPRPTPVFIAPGGQLQLDEPHVLQLDAAFWDMNEDPHLHGVELQVLHIRDDDADVDDGHMHGDAPQVLQMPVEDVVFGQRQFAVPHEPQLATAGVHLHAELPQLPQFDAFGPQLQFILPQSRQAVGGTL
jgi:hypothetical protein